MKQFKKLVSTTLPIRTENIDTDQIIPARFLKTTKKEGLGEFLFFNWRYDEHGHTLKDSVFADSKYIGAKILIAGNNFGCGSSREHAPWALVDYGFEAVISSSFGDIFYNNSLKNGLLPISVTQDDLDMLFQLTQNNNALSLTIDLENQTIFAGDKKITFPIDQFRKTCLLQGVDELGYIMSHEKKINEFEKKHQTFISP